MKKTPKTVSTIKKNFGSSYSTITVNSILYIAVQYKIENNTTYKISKNTMLVNRKITYIL